LLCAMAGITSPHPRLAQIHVNFTVSSPTKHTPWPAHAYLIWHRQMTRLLKRGWHLFSMARNLHALNQPETAIKSRSTPLFKGVGRQ